MLSGSLSYKKDTNSFYVNEVNSDDGWVPMPISISPQNLTSKDTAALLEKFGGSNQSRLYVDSTNPNSTDVKGNSGNSYLRPFRTLQRALLEVARRSFKRGENNDLFEKTSILVAPGEYTIYNGPSSELSDFQYYLDYQKASYLVQRNTDWVVNNAYNTLAVEQRTLTYKQYLHFVVNAIVNDLSGGTDTQTVNLARSFVADPNETPPAPNADDDYFITEFLTAAARTDFIAALNDLNTTNDIVNTVKLAAKNSGEGYTEPGVTFSTEATTSIEAKIDALISNIENTLNCSVNPHDIEYSASRVDINAFPEDYEPSGDFYQKFNAGLSAGVILPRGVSILGEDLRKVVFRPDYVPDRSGTTRGAIFKMTGANFFSGFTAKDNLEVAAEGKSHHMLSVFEFSKELELNEYYDKVNTTFRDNTIYNRAFDSANLLEKNIEWIEKKFTATATGVEDKYLSIFRAEISSYLSAVIRSLRSANNSELISFANRFRTSHINTLTTGQSDAITAYESLFDTLHPYIQLSYLNEANISEGGYQDPLVIIDIQGTTVTDDNGDPVRTGRCADITEVVYNYKDITTTIISSGVGADLSSLTLPASIVGFTLNDTEARTEETTIVSKVDFNNPILSNSTTGASPYIFSASLRSNYGMCGIHGDGSLVSGFKSYLAAQFTIVSLQNDPNAFEDSNLEVGGKRYKGSDPSDTQSYTHFGYKVSNGAYSQLVSCFCIGPARHYVAESGAEFSITNSTSNFGDVSLYSHGFTDDGQGGGAYPPDQEHKLLGVIKPKSLNISDVTQATNIAIGSVKSYSYLNAEDLESGADSYTILAAETTEQGLREAYFNPNLAWKSPPESWKTWIDTYLDTVTDTVELEVTRRNAVFPPSSDFDNISLVKLTLNRKISDRLGQNVDRFEDGQPDLRWIYTTALLENSDITSAAIVEEDTITIPNNEETIFPFVLVTNSSEASNAGISNYVLPGWYPNPAYGNTLAFNYYKESDFNYSRVSLTYGANVQLAWGLQINSNYSEADRAPFKFVPSGTSTEISDGTGSVTIIGGSWQLDLGWDTVDPGRATYVYNKVEGYNSNVTTPRRAKVLAVKENAQNETEIVIAVGSSYFTDNNLGMTSSELGATNVGEWFERSSIFDLQLPFNSYTPDTSTSRTPQANISFKTFQNRLVGKGLYIKRFTDSRRPDDKKYKFLFERKDASKRVAPLNYILRQYGASSTTQPYKETDTADLNTLFSVFSPQNFTVTDLVDLEDPVYTTDFGNLASTAESSKVFVSEFLSANSDEDYRAQSNLDIVENAKFYLYEDAQELAEKSLTERKNYVNIPYYDAARDPALYLSKQNTLKILDLPGLSYTPSLLDVSPSPADDSSRIIPLNTINYYVEFNKPSIIRASGQTWEYCGYYNYSTAIPALQTSILGINENIPLSEQNRFRFEKIQKSIWGGQVYSTGMDELGNVIQGNRYINLSTGQIEEVALGTSVEVAEIAAESGIIGTSGGSGGVSVGGGGGGGSLSSNFNPDLIELTGEFIALPGSTVDLSQGYVLIDCGRI